MHDGGQQDILNGWFMKLKCSDDLSGLDCQSSMHATKIIMDFTVPALFVKGTIEKASKNPNRTIGKIFMHLEEMVG